MEFKYKLTDSFLNAVTEFYRLHGALYALGDALPWKPELMKIAGDRAAIAAVSLDQDSDVDSMLGNNLEIVVPSERAVDFMNYRRTKDSLKDFFMPIDMLTLELFHQIHRSVLGLDENTPQQPLRKHTVSIPKAIYENGTYRKVEMKIRTKPGEIEERLKRLNSWIKSNYKLLNPVVKAAIIYYLLAKIHPYEDGNGRTAKIFIHGILYQNRIDIDNIIVIEEYYLKNRTQYYDILARAIETDDLTEWLDFFANALLYGALVSCKILLKLSGGSIDLLTGKYLKLTKNQQVVINALQHLPHSSGAEIGRKLELSRQYINNILDELIELGLVHKQGIGRGSVYRLTTNS